MANNLKDMIDNYNKDFSDDAVNARIKKNTEELNKIAKRKTIDVKDSINDLVDSLAKIQKMDKLDNIDMKSFVKAYSKWYERIYDDESIVPESKKRKLIDRAEKFCKKNNSFYKKFCAKHGDALTSDRELEAFMLTIDDFGVFDATDSVEEGAKKDGSAWTEDEVMKLIETNDKVLYGALKHLYACQTDDEKNSESTKEHNAKGFNATDAEFLTSLCKQLIERGFLTPKQREYARKKIKKYHKQLVALANS